MIVEEGLIIETDILSIIKKRENESTISFEECYNEGLKYNPSKNV